VKLTPELRGVEAVGPVIVARLNVELVEEKEAMTQLVAMGNWIVANADARMSACKRRSFEDSTGQRRLLIVQVGAMGRAARDAGR
jgi:hypothetical protein